MKKLNFILFAFSFLFLAATSNTKPLDESELYRQRERNENAAKEVSKWKERLELSRDLPDDEKVIFLAKGLQKMDSFSRISDNEETKEVLALLQSEILSTPNYAQHYRNKIESSRESGPQMIDGGWRGYTEYRYLFLGEALKYLKSPESIVVLGEYLDDKTDPFYPESTPPNAFLATGSLGAIGIREAPITKDRPNIQELRENNSQWREWYAKVKSGEIPFSFIGQDVQYRFKADGTVETSPYDGPPDPPVVKKVVRKETSLHGTHDPSPPRDGASWIIGGVVAIALMLILLGFFLSKRRNR